MSGLDKFVREREFCKICERPINYAEESGWFNVDAVKSWVKVDISEGHCSWHPCCEIVICSKCIEEDREKCVQTIMDMLR